jgi:hypothetical protein
LRSSGLSGAPAPPTPLLGRYHGGNGNITIDDGSGIASLTVDDSLYIGGDRTGARRQGARPARR